MATNKQRPQALRETDYIPEKGKDYRETFQERHGRTWSEHINHWRQRHPEYRERARAYVAKARLIARLNLKSLLAAWGLPPTEVASVLRRIPYEQLAAFDECLADWDRLTGKAKRTALNLLTVLHARHVSFKPRTSVVGQPTTGGEAL